MKSPKKFDFTKNALQINFDEVLRLPDATVVAMFKTLIASGLREFLGCPGIFYKEALDDFFTSAAVIESSGDIRCTVKGKSLLLKKKNFASFFKLPTSGQRSISNLPTDLVAEMQTRFSLTGKPFRRSENNNKALKIEYRLLHDVVTKSLLAKPGSFTSLTRERLDLMVAISKGLDIDWATVLFDILKSMVRNHKRQTKGFAVQISLILKSLAHDHDVGPSAKLQERRVMDNKIMAYYKNELAAERVPKKRSRADEGESAPLKKGLSNKGQKSDDDDEPAAPRMKGSVTRARLQAEEETEAAEKQESSVKEESSSSAPSDTVPSEEEDQSVQLISPSDTESDSESFRLLLQKKIERSARPKLPEERATNVGIKIREPSDHRDKGCKGAPANNGVDAAFALVLQDVETRTREQLEQFDKWREFRTCEPLRTIKSMEVLRKMGQLETQLLQLADTDRIPDALKRRELVELVTRRSSLQRNISQHQQNFDPNRRTDVEILGKLCLEEAALNLRLATVKARLEAGTDAAASPTASPENSRNAKSANSADQSVPTPTSLRLEMDNLRAEQLAASQELKDFKDSTLQEFSSLRSEIKRVGSKSHADQIALIVQRLVGRREDGDDKKGGSGKTQPSTQLKGGKPRGAGSQPFY